MVRLFAIAALMLSSTLGSVLDCAPTNSLFKLTSMSLSPDPVVNGQNSTLKLAMNVPEQIDAGTLIYAITYSFIPLAPITENLCNTVSCPILPGTLITRSSYPIDPLLSGSLQIKINWKDNSSRNLICVNVQTRIVSVGKQLLTYSNKPMLPLPMCPLYQNMSYKTLIKAYKRAIKKTVKGNESDTKSKLRGKAL